MELCFKIFVGTLLKGRGLEDDIVNVYPLLLFCYNK